MAYSVLTYLEAYLSYYHPIEFYCAVLRNVTRGKNGDRGKATVNAKRRGVVISPPDINNSFENYEVYCDEEGKSAGIVVGLGAVKGVGEKISPKIIEERDTNGDFEGLDDFIKRTKPRGISKTHIKALIFAGAFDEFEANRYTLMLYYYEKYGTVASGTKFELTSENIFRKSDIEKAIFKGFRATKDEEAVPPLLKEEEYNRLLGLEYEVRYLDQYTSEHPLSNINNKYHIDLDDYLDGESVEFVGLVVKSVRKDDKNGNKYAILTVELASGVLIEAKVWRIEKASKTLFPPRLLQVPRKEANSTLEEIDKIKKKIEAKAKKKNRLSEEDLETYRELYRIAITNEYIAEERTFRPVMFNGTVNLYNGEKSVNLKSISAIDSQVLTRSRKKKVVTSYEVDIEDDI